MSEVEYLRARENIYDVKTRELLYKKASIVDDKIVVEYAKRHGLLTKNFDIPEKFLGNKTKGELMRRLRVNGNDYYQLHIDLVRDAREIAEQGGDVACGILRNLPDTDDPYEGEI